MKLSKYFKLKKKPELIMKLTGLSVERVEEILEKLVPVFIAYEIKRLAAFSKKRIRVFGGGRKTSVDLDDKLLMYLMYHYLFVTHEFLGDLFNLHNCNTSRQTILIGKLLKNIYQAPKKGIVVAGTRLSNSEILEIFDGLDKAVPEPSAVINNDALLADGPPVMLYNVTKLVQNRGKTSLPMPS